LWQTKREFIDHVRGKIIERIVIVADPDALELDIRFQDNTSFAVQLEPDIEVRVENAELLGWKDGNARVLRKLS
jgi:hypothetical protein